MFTHQIGEPLKEWRRVGTSLPAHEILLWPEWAAIRLSHKGLQNWDRVFDSTYSLPLHGEPGVIPQHLDGRPGRFLVAGRWHFVPAEYLPRLDPAWLKGVRRLPEFGELSRVPDHYPVDFGSGIKIAPSDVLAVVEIPRQRASEVLLHDGGSVEVPEWPEFVREALRDPRFALFRFGPREDHSRRALLEGLLTRLNDEAVTR